jgi:predicted metal-binding membrane protein
LASTVLIAAGVYQWTPLNNTCLTHCRSPTEFMIRHWDPRSFGAVRTGLRNGLFSRLLLDAEGRFCSSAD